MAQSKCCTSTLVILIATLAVARAQSVYPPLHPTYDNDTNPSETPVVPTSVPGYARFFGPLSAGCKVLYESTGNTSVTIPGGLLSPLNSEVMVENCTDSFTGLPLPYYVAGVSGVNGSFQVSSTQTIAAASTWALPDTPYRQLGYYNWMPELYTGDIFQMMRDGTVNVTAAFDVLKTDVKFIATSALLYRTLMNATAGNGTMSCNNRQSIHRFFANWVASRYPISFNSSNIYDVHEAVMAYTRAPCYFNIANNQTAATILMITSVSDFIERSMGYHKWAVQDLAFMARVASFASSEVDVTALADSLHTARDLFMSARQAPIVPAAICSALGIEGYAAVDTKVTIQWSGPLRTTKVVYLPFTDVFNQTLAPTNANGSVTVPRATMGIYTVPAGSIDTHLTVNDSKPVTTLLPFTAVMGFTPSGTAVVSPIGAIVLQTILSQMSGNTTPSVIPDAAAFRKAYEDIAGRLPDGDCMTRTFNSKNVNATAALAGTMQGVDSLVPNIPALGGKFIMRALRNSNPERVSQLFFKLLIGQPQSTYTTTSKIVSIIKAVYKQVRLESSNTTSTVTQYRRRLSQSEDGDDAATVDAELVAMETILTKVADTISNSNAVVTSILNEAKTALDTGAALPADTFVKLAQVAQVQSTTLAAAIEDVAAKVEAGDLTAAEAAATTVQADYTGDALQRTVDAAPVNTEAIANDSPTTAPPTEADDHAARRRTIGLAAGLTVGLTALAALGVGIAFYVKSQAAAVAMTALPVSEA